MPTTAPPDQSAALQHAKRVLDGAIRVHRKLLDEIPNIPLNNRDTILRGLQIPAVHSSSAHGRSRSTAVNQIREIEVGIANKAKLLPANDAKVSACLALLAKEHNGIRKNISNECQHLEELRNPKGPHQSKVHPAAILKAAHDSLDQAQRDVDELNRTANRHARHIRNNGAKATPARPAHTAGKAPSRSPAPTNLPVGKPPTNTTASAAKTAAISNDPIAPKAPAVSANQKGENGATTNPAATSPASVDPGGTDAESPPTGINRQAWHVLWNVASQFHTGSGPDTGPEPFRQPLLADNLMPSPADPNAIAEKLKKNLTNGKVDETIVDDLKTASPLFREVLPLVNPRDLPDIKVAYEVQDGKEAKGAEANSLVAQVLNKAFPDPKPSDFQTSDQYVTAMTHNYAAKTIALYQIHEKMYESAYTPLGYEMSTHYAPGSGHIPLSTYDRESDISGDTNQGDFDGSVQIASAYENQNPNYTSLAKDKLKNYIEYRDHTPGQWIDQFGTKLAEEKILIKDPAKSKAEVTTWKDVWQGAWDWP